jgi:hypothetical protein
MLPCPEMERRDNNPAQSTASVEGPLVSIHLSNFAPDALGNENKDSIGPDLDAIVQLYGILRISIALAQISGLARTASGSGTFQAVPVHSGGALASVIVSHKHRCKAMAARLHDTTVLDFCRDREPSLSLTPEYVRWARS